MQSGDFEAADFHLLLWSEYFFGAMKSIGYVTDFRGMCYGLTYSMRDAFLAGDFTKTYKLIRDISDKYEACQRTELEESARLAAHSFKRMDELSRWLSAGGLPAEQKEAFEKERITCQLHVHNALKRMTDYVANPIDSYPAESIRSSFAARNDVLLAAKESALSALLAELEDGPLGYHDQMIAVIETSQLDTLYLYKTAEVDRVVEMLLNDPVYRERMSQHLAAAMDAIDPKALEFWNTMKGIFERVILYQASPAAYSHFTGAAQTDGLQNASLIYPLVETRKLEKLGGAAHVGLVTGTYFLAGLVEYFTSLQRALSLQDHPIAMTLSNRHHIMMVGYHPREKMFYFFDQNAQAIYSSNPELIANHVMKSLAERKIQFALDTIDLTQLLPNSYLVTKNPCVICYVNPYRMLEAIPSLVIIPEALAQEINALNFSNPIHHSLTDKIYDAIAHDEAHQINHPRVAILTSRFYTLSQHHSNELVSNINEWAAMEVMDSHYPTAEAAAIYDSTMHNYFTHAFEAENYFAIKHGLKLGFVVPDESILMAIASHRHGLLAFMADNGVDIQESHLAYAEALGDMTAVKIILTHLLSKSPRQSSVAEMVTRLNIPIDASLPINKPQPVDLE